jgi:hypothetical protein
VGSERSREAGPRPAGQPALQAAVAGRVGSERSRAAAHEAADPEGSALARAAHEAADRAAFVLWRAARPDAAVVAEPAARWPAAGGQEVHWRPAGVAGQAPLGAARLEAGAGRAAACRLPEADHLARGEFRRSSTQKESIAHWRRQKALQCKAVGNCVSSVPRRVGDAIRDRCRTRVGRCRLMIRRPRATCGASHSDWKRRQHAKTAARIPDDGRYVGLMDVLSQRIRGVSSHASRCRRPACPVTPSETAQSKQNRGGRDKSAFTRGFRRARPGHDPGEMADDQYDREPVLDEGRLHQFAEMRVTSFAPPGAS